MALKRFHGTSTQKPASIDVNGGARDKLVLYQKHNALCDLSRGAGSRNHVFGGHFTELPLAVLAVGSEHRRVDNAGRDDVDAPRSQLRSDRAHKLLHCTPNRGKGDLSRLGTLCRHAADQDDAAPGAEVFRAQPHNIRVSPKLVKRRLITVQVHLQERSYSTASARGGADQDIKRSLLGKELRQCFSVAYIALAQRDAWRSLCLAGISANGHHFGT
mmetsp:Transcript_117058/g.342879  ORF Transcript_117058/g.342879 Transcript_117058/m.342879 type:complete len:216 (+) Transcript_117058:69-716(+)